MAAIFADAAVFGYKALSKESASSSYDEKTISITAEPWNNLRPQDPCPCTRQDFIIFAEFSEITGPIPLLTIPPHAEDSTGIDINNFIMRIMSLDYQANPSQSVFCEDAQVLQMSIIPGLHVYVHYLTLHDPVARGFVRPLCLAYVSADQYKLSDMFPMLRKEFLQISQVVKHDNRLWFREEISSILRCIKETQNEYLYWKKKVDDGAVLSDEEQHILDHTNMDQLVQQYTDYTHILHALGPLLKADAGKSDAMLGYWKSGFARADKADIILSALHNNSHHNVLGTSGNCLKGVLALSPWGLSAAIWNLLVLLRIYRECRLKQNCSKVTIEEEHSTMRDNVEEAVNDSEYLQLIQYLAELPEQSVSKSSFHHGDSSSSNNIQNTVDILEANIMSGGNEVASSYHSVPESLSEILAGARISGGEGEDEINKAEEVIPGLTLSHPDFNSNDNSSNESFLDISETSSVTEDNWRASPENSEEKKSHCVWSCHKTGFGILKFFKTYDKAAHHVLYSLLIGRTVVFVGDESSEHKAAHIMNILSPYVPVMPDQEVNILSWHRGILVPSHISSYHMIGVCVPERLSVHDMISSKDKNSVTILDVTSKQLFGPAYSGQILSSLERTARYMPSDQSLLLFLQTIAASLNEKIFMYLTLIKMKPVPEKSRSRQSPGSDVLKDLGLDGCDAEIVRNLSRIGSVNWSPLV
ncbi:hypothetical protein ANN_09230 [Periplaneta americana]|uniref:UDENN FLCN/SMCR8-type domain-containing protein n=1 Tax=Periplaneta americana TaxID=6978 RepID=A0ABQ8TNA6_PERAM|nr:hypothetical protein ANN_09230 [Periplaneta americana]